MTVDRQIAKRRIKLGARGVRVPREPSSLPVEHLRYDWFPIQTLPGKERLARLLLEDRGLVTFCPTLVRWRNRNQYDRARRDKRRIEYLWHPRLVLVGFETGRPYPWHILAFCPVVSCVISTTQDQPRRMRHADVWRLMLKFGHGRFVAPEHQRWMPTGGEVEAGDCVRVIAGPLAERTFKVEQIKGRMAVVFAEFFGADRGFEIPLEHLECDG